MTNALEIITARYGISTPGALPVRLPASRHHGLLEIWREAGYRAGAEIGVEEGRYSSEICAAIPGVRLHCIDPWAAYDRYADHVSQAKLDAFHDIAVERLAPYNAEIIRLPSLEAVKMFAPGSLDFVFIDGNHHFDFVVQDIIAWAPIVRPGGMVAGHDYKPEGHEKIPIPFGVIEAVNAYTAAHKINPWFIFARDKCPTWAWVKA